MPQAAQQDYLRLPIKSAASLTEGEQNAILRGLTFNTILDTLIETAGKVARVVMYDTSGAVPVVKTTENTITCIRALKAKVDDVEANVGESLTADASLAASDTIQLTFSDKLPVGSYAGVVKTTEDVSVTFAIATNPNATMTATLDSTAANKLKGKAIVSITATILGNSVTAVFPEAEGA